MLPSRNAIWLPVVLIAASLLAWSGQFTRNSGHSKKLTSAASGKPCVSVTLDGVRLGAPKIVSGNFEGTHLRCVEGRVHSVFGSVLRFNNVVVLKKGDNIARIYALLGKPNPTESHEEPITVGTTFLFYTERGLSVQIVNGHVDRINLFTQWM